MQDIDPQYIADPANAEAIHARAMNTSNVNPVPTTQVPVKSQAVEGSTAERRAQELAEAGAATVDPAPRPEVPADLAENPTPLPPGVESREAPADDAAPKSSRSTSAKDDNK